MPDGLQYVPCALCGKDLPDSLLKASCKVADRVYPIHLVKCKNCGLIYVNPRPQQEVLEIVQDIAGQVGQDTRWMTGSTLRSLLARSWAVIFPSLVLAMLSAPKGKLLDLGCGSGYLLDKLRRIGWDVVGVDTSPTAVKLASSLGFKVLHGPIENLGLPEKSFDACVLSHVLEHLPNPLRTLSEIRRILRQGGDLVVSCPNFRCAERRIFGLWWMHLALPLHLYHYTPDTLRLILEKASFSIKEVAVRSSHPTFGWNVAAMIGKQWAWKVAPIFAPIQLTENLLGIASIMTAHALKN